MVAVGASCAAGPGTLLGVAALGEPDLLVEVEAVAVLPGPPVLGGRGQ